MQGSLKIQIPFVCTCPPRIPIRGFVLPVGAVFRLRDERFFRQPEIRFTFLTQYLIRMIGRFCAGIL